MLDLLEQAKTFWLWLISPTLSLLNCFLVILCICLIYFYVVRDRHPRRNSFTISSSSVFLLGMLILSGVQGGGGGEGPETGKTNTPPANSNAETETVPPSVSPKIPSKPPRGNRNLSHRAPQTITILFGDAPYTCTIRGDENLPPIAIDESDAPNPRDTFWAQVRQGVQRQRVAADVPLKVEILNAPGMNVREYARNMIQMYFPDSEVITHHD